MLLNPHSNLYTQNCKFCSSEYIQVLLIFSCQRLNKTVLSYPIKIGVHRAHVFFRLGLVNSLHYFTVMISKYHSIWTLCHRFRTKCRTVHCCNTMKKAIRDSIFGPQSTSTQVPNVPPNEQPDTWPKHLAIGWHTTIQPLKNPYMLVFNAVLLPPRNKSDIIHKTKNT